MRFFIGAVVLSFALVSAVSQYPEAPAGFDNKSNGVVDDVAHQADQVKFAGGPSFRDVAKGWGL